MTFARVTQGKSTNKEVYSQYSTKAVVADLTALGHKRLIPQKTDQEPAMLVLQECVRVASDAEIFLGNSAVESHSQMELLRGRQGHRGPGPDAEACDREQAWDLSGDEELTSGVAAVARGCALQQLP